MFKKKTAKVISLALALMMSAGFVACGSNDTNDTNDPDNIHLEEGQTLFKISAFNGGYGLDWLDAITKAYSEEHPEVVFYYRKDEVNRANQRTALESGAAEEDLFITGSFNIHAQLDTGRMQLAELTDVYDTIGEKLIPSVTEWYEHEDKQYAVPWGTAMLGILYRSDFFKSNKIQVPRTSTELLSAAKKITSMQKNERSGPFAFTYSDNITTGECYIDYLLNAWMAQYEGVNGYEKYWDFKLKDGTSCSSDITISYEYQSVLRILEVYEEILKPSNNYNHYLSTSNTFTAAQGQFLRGDAKMMFNGDWVVQEMRKNDAYNKYDTSDVRFMKTPILSSIVETMPMWKEASTVHYTVDPDSKTNIFPSNHTELSATKKANYENALVAIIDYVDGVTTKKPTSVSGITITQKDIDRIKEARNITPTMADGHVMVVPENSKNKDIAKDFIKFMYSDKGIELYSKNVYGTGLPVNYTQEQIDEIVGDSEMMRSAYDMLGEDAYLTFYFGGKHPAFTAGGLKPTYRSDATDFVIAMSVKNLSSYESAYLFYQKSQSQISHPSTWPNFIIE